MELGYITQYNFKRLAGFCVQPEVSLPLEKLFSAIYERNLAEVLNTKEAENLYIQKEMLENRTNHLRTFKQVFSSNYVFAVGVPKFHKDTSCKFLKLPFSNYLVPQEIKQLGDDKIKEFQDFCESTKEEFRDKREDVFWAHVGAKFRVHIRPEAILYDNSGVQDVSQFKVDELRNNINSQIDNIVGLANTPDGAVAMKSYRYAPATQRVLSQIHDSEMAAIVKQYFRAKREIISSLFEMYKKQANVSDCALPVPILRACGLEPCSACVK